MPYKTILKIFAVCLLILFAISAGFFMTNFGPGSQDFSVKIARNYYIHRTSAHQIMIAPEGWNDSIPTIPTKVIECDTDKRFIIAKRQGLKRRSPGNPNDTYEEPDPKVFDYWILDTAVPKVYGPLKVEEFNAKRKELSVPAALSLKDVYTFRRKLTPN
jgi:uncharacterized protein DUF3997